MDNLRILICDDDQEVANALARLLRVEGYQVEICSDGASAIRLAKETCPQMAFLDLGLPDMSGYEVCKSIRALLGEYLLGVFAVTGWHDDGTRRRSREAGFDRHFLKPVKYEQLREAIREFTPAN